MPPILPGQAQKRGDTNIGALHGYHPVAGDPRTDLYYLNVMAGPVRAWRVATAPGY